METIYTDPCMATYSSTCPWVIHLLWNVLWRISIAWIDRALHDTQWFSFISIGENFWQYNKKREGAKFTISYTALTDCCVNTNCPNKRLHPPTTGTVPYLCDTCWQLMARQGKLRVQIRIFRLCSVWVMLYLQRITQERCQLLNLHGKQNCMFALCVPANIAVYSYI